MLRTVSFQAGSRLERVEKYCFCDSGVEEIRTPQNVRFIAHNAFSCCANLKLAVLNEGLETLGEDTRECVGDEPLAMMPGQYTYDGEQRSHGGVFASSGLENVQLPSTLKRLESKAFYKCGSLKTISLPQGLEYIGEKCFFGSALEEFIAPASLRAVDEEAFSGCKCLRQAVLNDGLEALGDGHRSMIFHDSGLEEVTLAATLKTIGFNTFSECENLKIIYVRDGCSVDLFFTASAAIKIGPPPETVVGGVSVWDLRALKDIVIPDGTERIGNYWFFGCGVETVTMPASVTEIGDYAFWKCERLKSLVLAEGSRLEIVGSRCFEGTGLEEIKMPENLQVIKEYAFSRCKNLKRAFLNSDLKALEQ